VSPSDPACVQERASVLSGRYSAFARCVLAAARAATDIGPASATAGGGAMRSSRHVVSHEYFPRKNDRFLRDVGELP